MVDRENGKIEIYNIGGIMLNEKKDDRGNRSKKDREE
jgi:hypothetical protein